MSSCSSSKHSIFVIALIWNIEVSELSMFTSILVELFGADVDVKSYSLI